MNENLVVGRDGAKATSDCYTHYEGFEMEFRYLDPLSGRVMVSGEVVIANDPSNDPRAGGLPPGHPPLDRFLGLPFYFWEKLVGKVGIANRPNGYDDTPGCSWLRF